MCAGCPVVEVENRRAPLWFGASLVLLHPLFPTEAMRVTSGRLASGLAEIVVDLAA